MRTARSPEPGLTGTGNGQQALSRRHEARPGRSREPPRGSSPGRAAQRRGV